MGDGVEFEEVKAATLKHGAAKVSRVLGVSRNGLLGVISGVAHAGTKHLVKAKVSEGALRALSAPAPERVA